MTVSKVSPKAVRKTFVVMASLALGLGFILPANADSEAGFFVIGRGLNLVEVLPTTADKFGTFSGGGAAAFCGDRNLRGIAAFCGDRNLRGRAAGGAPRAARVATIRFEIEARYATNFKLPLKRPTRRRRD